MTSMSKSAWERVKGFSSEDAPTPIDYERLYLTDSVFHAQVHSGAQALVHILNQPATLAQWVEAKLSAFTVLKALYEGGSVLVSRDDLHRMIEHLDDASRATGGEPCEASFVWRLRQALGEAS